MPGAILVGNPTAQSGRAAASITRALELLAAAGLDPTLLPTEPGGATIGAVRKVIEGGARTLVAMGGDGTFAEVAKGILGSPHAGEVAMGMLPTGTANDQAKSFGMDTGEAALAANVDIIAGGHIYELDVGRVQVLDERGEVIRSDLFFDSFSIGLGAAVLAERNRDRERAGTIPVVRALYRDHAVYAGALVKQLAASLGRGATFTLEAVIDGQTRTYERVLDVIVKNTPVYGGEWILAPDAKADDGLLELVPICGLGDLGGRMVSTLRGSPIGEQSLRALGVQLEPPVAGRRFDLTVLQPGATSAPPGQIDGEELIGCDHVRVEALARILRLIVPAPETRHKSVHD